MVAARTEVHRPNRCWWVVRSGYSKSGLFSCLGDLRSERDRDGLWVTSGYERPRLRSGQVTSLFVLLPSRVCSE